MEQLLGGSSWEELHLNPGHSTIMSLFTPIPTVTHRRFHPVPKVAHVLSTLSPWTTRTYGHIFLMLKNCGKPGMSSGFYLFVLCLIRAKGFDDY